jgi:hypothetical protein
LGSAIVCQILYSTLNCLSNKVVSEKNHINKTEQSKVYTHVVCHILIGSHKLHDSSNQISKG